MITEAEPPPPPPLPPLIRPAGPPPLEVLVVVVLHAVLDGATVTVTAPETTGRVTVFTPPLQLVVMPPTAGSVVTERFGALIIMVEPDCSVAVKLAAPTAMVSNVALEPDTFMETLSTEITVSVVRVTSLYAPNATAGSKSAISIPVRVSNFFIMMNSYEP